MLKLLICCVAVTLAFSRPANAYYCSKPSEPSLPDGSASNRDEMESAQDEVNSYIDEMNEYVQCLNKEANDAISEANDLRDRWNNEVSAFNGN